VIPTVSALWVYPVKSCAGIPLERAEVTDTGLAHDRELMVVDADGSFLSQRSEPRLALVRPTLSSDGVLRLEAPGVEPLQLELEAEGDRREVEVWGDRVSAVSLGAVAERWFSSWLGRPCTLVRMPPDTVRPVDVDHAGPGHRVGFADGYPFLLLSEGSLDELNRRLEIPLPMDRFRPNVVVDGCPPHAEDRWRRLRIGEVELRVVKPCSRCSITTVDQATGARGPEPLATLAGYRRWGGKVLFGQNLVHESRGTLRVGAVVDVLESGRPVPDPR
jgi:uncharacterized protein YcbX